MPGLRHVRALLRSSGKGDWIYSRQALVWMRDPELYAQLPPAVRVFVGFCRIQLALGSRVHGGRVAQALAALAHRRSEGDVSVRLRSGDRVVHLDPRDPRMLVVPNEVFGETPVGRAITRHLEAGDTFIDVGANHGAYSIVAASIVGSTGTVVAFEPQPRLARLVEASLSETFRGRFSVFQLACGARRDRVRLFIPRDSSGEGGLFEAFSADAGHRSEWVPLDLIDRVLDGTTLTGRVLMKLDAEGSEFAALQGAEALIEERRPILVLEVNPRSMEAANVPVAALRVWLAERGYRWFSRLRGNPRPEGIEGLDEGVHGNLVLGMDAEGARP